MDDTHANLNTLVDEYSAVLCECTAGMIALEEIPWNAIQDRLVADCEWTPVGAQHLVDLVSNYGAFVLRNAAALAIAIDVDDGALGL